MWLIVGLGNPGAKYELTRHNFGFLVIDHLLEQMGENNSKTKFNALVADVLISGEKCMTIKPQTFMNRSGSSVQQAMAFHKIHPDNIIVLHDELDLALGDIRIKKGGGLSGHNGLKDISRLIGPDFYRIRLGIGRPNFKGTEADYVLKTFSDKELVQVEEDLDKALRAIELLITKDLKEAQRLINIKK